MNKTQILKTFILKRHNQFKRINLQENRQLQLENILNNNQVEYRLLKD